MSKPAVSDGFIPVGPERVVRFLGSATIAGAPVAYVVVLAAVIAVFSFVPFSIVLSSGSSFPMSQGIYPLTGWLLGPWAGAVASGVGTLVGIFLAPHTAGIPWITVAGATAASLYAGAIVPGRRRVRLGAVLGGVGVLQGVLFFVHATQRNGVAPWLFITAYLTHVVALLLFLLPTRRWIGGLIASPNLKAVALGLFLGTWCAASLMMFGESAVSYHLLNWPGELFFMFIGIVPIEHTIRSGIGAVVGAGVIAGLRAISLVRPREATY